MIICRPSADVAAAGAVCCCRSLVGCVLLLRGFLVFPSLVNLQQAEDSNSCASSSARGLNERRWPPRRASS